MAEPNPQAPENSQDGLEARRAQLQRENAEIRQRLAQMEAMKDNLVRKSLMNAGGITEITTLIEAQKPQKAEAPAEEAKKAGM